MKSISVIGLVLVLGFALGAFISPLRAQQQSAIPAQATCYVGEGSNAACSGSSIYFAGNTSGIDDGVWVVRVDGETGKISYRNGKKLVTLSEDQ